MTRVAIVVEDIERWSNRVTVLLVGSNILEGQ